jgi:uncharacterized protein (TIGR02145 family)
MREKVSILISLCFFTCFSFMTCEKDKEPESITNKLEFSEVKVDSVGYREAKISYELENLDKNDLQTFGICYNTPGEPTREDSTVSLTADSSGTKTIDGLSPDMKYYFRLYAELGGRTVYSNERNFSTNSLAKPSVTTVEITNVDTTTATTGGIITDNGGLSITARGVCWSTSQNPTINDNSTLDGSGTGSFTSEITGLTEGTMYYVRAYATNEKGTAYGYEVSFLGGPNGTFTDHRDGKIYKWVRIGDQVWMAENLNYNAGGDSWCYDNNSSNCDTYGRLYDWATAMQGDSSSNNNPSGVQGICPDGWHLPSDEEWKELEMQLGMSQSEADNVYRRGTNEGSKLAGNDFLWDSGDLTSDSEFDTSGFAAFPGGDRTNDGNFLRIGSHGYWWSSTESSYTNAWYRNLNYDYISVYREDAGKELGLSVRCVRDE